MLLLVIGSQYKISFFKFFIQIGKRNSARNIKIRKKFIRYSFHTALARNRYFKISISLIVQNFYGIYNEFIVFLFALYCTNGYKTGNIFIFWSNLYMPEIMRVYNGSACSLIIHFSESNNFVLPCSGINRGFNTVFHQ